MNAQPGVPPNGNRPNVATGIVARFGQVLVVFAAQAAILFFAAGRLDWAWAWVFLGIYLGSMAVNGVLLMRTSPETVAERGRPKETRDWDKVVGGLWGLAQFLGLPLVAGLDARFGWTRELGTAWHVLGAVLMAAGLGLFGWAMIANAFFSTAVRIQSDRGHTVCQTGPYHFLRHPGYAGTILQSFGIPIALGSFWALIVGIPAAILMIIRTSLEDRTLQAELPGYRDFVREVRYRLLPGIW